MSTNLLTDQNHIALPGIEHLPMDDELVADAADMAVLEESMQSESGNDFVRSPATKFL